MMGLGQFLNQPQLRPRDLDIEVAELQVHREHDREALKDIKLTLGKIQWWLLILALTQGAMFLYLLGK